MSFTDTLETRVMNWAFTDAAATRPTEWYLGLFTAAPSDTGGGTEVSGGAYARQAATFAVSGTEPVQATTTAAVQWPEATATWGEITHAAVFDALTGGNMLAYAALVEAKTILSTDVLRISAGKFTITLN